MKVETSTILYVLMLLLALSMGFFAGWMMVEEKSTAECNQFIYDNFYKQREVIYAIDYPFPNSTLIQKRVE